jgi:hypothetical protein
MHGHMNVKVGNWLPVYAVNISQGGIYHLHLSGSLTSRLFKIIKPKVVILIGAIPMYFH